MILGLAAVLFGIFIFDVVMGASGGERLLGDAGGVLGVLAGSFVSCRS
jgi:hypothetical protein